MGGLGNQLFQYAFAKELEARRGVPATLDPGWFSQPLRRSPSGLVLREYELSGLDDSLMLAAPQSSVKAEFAHALWWVRRNLAARRSGHFAGLSVEESSDFEAWLLTPEAGPNFWGYFASWRYFVTVADEVRTRVDAWCAQFEGAADLVARARREVPIGIHVRRGDYVGLAKVFGELRCDYYAAAIERLRQSGLNGPVWLFSDDPYDAVRILGGVVAVDYTVGTESPLSSAATLAVMSATGGLVMANSTFSWWGGFLGDTGSRPVVTPETYLRTQGIPQSPDFYYPGWIDLWQESTTSI
jgi:hypothetical protein